ncbi:hypothetical protein [Rugamonas sp. DEMB1]|uniref:hypothetical protein n=1 Tax=Rugamonas sp. DEMB1 TaxID=3039386 RepID=UPI00391915AB
MIADRRRRHRGYDPAGKAPRVVAKGLGFANGIALSADENSVPADLQDRAAPRR